MASVGSNTNKEQASKCLALIALGISAVYSKAIAWTGGNKVGLSVFVSSPAYVLAVIVLVWLESKYVLPTNEHHFELAV